MADPKLGQLGVWKLRSREVAASERPIASESRLPHNSLTATADSGFCLQLRP